MHHLYNPQPASRRLLSIALVVMITISALLSGCVTGSAPKPAPYLREQGNFFMQAGIESYTQFNFALATEQFTQARNFYSRFDDYLGTTNALLNLAQTAFAKGNYEATTQYLLKADHLIQRHDLKQQAIYRDMLLTNLYLATDKLADAEKIFTPYDTMLRNKLADNISLNLLINRVRYAQLTNQEFSVWLNLLTQQTSANNNAEISARLQRFNAWQAFLANDATLGNQLFDLAHTGYREQANPGGLMATQLEWAQACFNMNDWTHAAEHYEQALNLSMLNSHAPNGLRALNGLRIIYQKIGSADKQLQMDEWAKQLRSIPAEETGVTETK